MWDLLGLDARDVAVYRSFIRNPDATPEQVARETGLCEDQVAASRARLIASGLARAEPGGGVSAIPTAPETVRDRLRAASQEEHARRQDQIAALHAEVSRLVEEQGALSSQRSASRVTHLPDAVTARARLVELVHGARAEIALLATGATLVRGLGVEALAPATGAAVARGLDVRTIHATSTLVDPVVRAAVGREIQAGVQVRTAVVTMPNLLLFDRNTALLLDPDFDNGQDDALILRGRSLLHTLVGLFDTWWSRAGDVRGYLDEAMPGEAGPTQEERVLLRLLCEGVRDEVAARQLGVSVRTVRRKISTLMRRLSANSRFHAGAIAAQRGWL